jgi:hypothetical protein
LIEYFLKNRYRPNLNVTDSPRLDFACVSFTQERNSLIAEPDGGVFVYDPNPRTLPAGRVPPKL